MTFILIGCALGNNGGWRGARQRIGSCQRNRAEIILVLMWMPRLMPITRFHFPLFLPLLLLLLKRALHSPKLFVVELSARRASSLGCFRSVNRYRSGYCNQYIIYSAPLVFFFFFFFFPFVFNPPTYVWHALFPVSFRLREKYT